MGVLSAEDLRNLKANKRSSASITSSTGDGSNLVLPNGKNVMAINDALGMRLEARNMAKDAIRREISLEGKET
jgi:hypothetical protein